MNELHRATSLPHGWRGFVMETVCREPWVALLFHDKLASVQARGITKEQAVAKAVKETRKLTACDIRA